MRRDAAERSNRPGTLGGVPRAEGAARCPRAVGAARCRAWRGPRLAALAVACGALVAVPAIAPRGAGAAVPVAGLTVLAAGNGQAVGQANGVVYSAFVAPSIAQSGEVLFLADIVGGTVPNFTTAILHGLPGALQPVVQEGGVAPGTGSTTWADLVAPAFTTRGSANVLFGGRLTGATAPTDTGVWAGTPGALALVAREGDPAHVAPGVLYADLNFFSPANVLPSMNSGGQVAYRAFLTGLGVTLTNDEAMYAGPAGGAIPVVREGAIAVGAGAATFIDAGGGAAGQVCFTQPSINSGGKILFASQLTGVGVTPGNAAGLWFGLPAAYGLALRAGAVAPGLTNQTFLSFTGRPILNDADQIAFVAHTTDPTGFVTFDGIWVGPTQAFTKVVASGDSAPTDPSSATFGNVFLSPRLNGAGQVAFIGSLAGAQWGVYGYDPANGLTRLARSGMQAPGMPAGESFSVGLNGVFLNNAGKVLFRDTTAPSGITGLWIGDVATGQVDLLVRTGAPTAVDGAQRTFTDVRVYGGGDAGDAEDGRASAIADDGNVVFLGTFSDGTPVIVRTGTGGGGGGGGGGCTDVPTCRVALQAALPDPALAANRKSRRVATSLRSYFNRMAVALDKAATLTGSKQARKRRSARTNLTRIVNAATAADRRGRLGVALAPLTGAANALKSFIP